MNNDQYEKFLLSKKFKTMKSGFAISESELHPVLFPAQKAIAKWQIERGNAGIFAAVGFGKTLLMLEWCKKMISRNGLAALIVAPLAVAHQTKKMAADIMNYEVNIAESQDCIIPGQINITNYEKIHKFRLDNVNIAFDESSVFKGNGQWYQYALDNTRDTENIACYTATPSPNSYMELGRHMELLKVMKYKEFLNEWFVHDSGNVQEWRLKRHSEQKFWKFMSETCIVIEKPSDIGFEDGSGYNLPGLNFHNHVIETNVNIPGVLLPLPASSMSERQAAARITVGKKVEMVFDIINSKPDESWCIWVNRNDESKAIIKAIEECIEVAGEHTDDVKTERLLGFAAGKYKRMVTKPKIGGWGLNLQICHNVIYFPNDSQEQLHQVKGRFHRYGQNKNVNFHMISSDIEGNVTKNLLEKEARAEVLRSEMKKYTKAQVYEQMTGKVFDRLSYNPKIKMKLPKFLEV